MGITTEAAPDYYGAARSTAREDAKQNRPNINTPWAQQQWTQNRDGTWGMQTGFSGGMQQAAQGLQGQVGGLSQPMDWKQFGPLDDGSAARDEAITGAYNQSLSRLEPEWQQREGAMRQQLANQGLDPGSEAARGAGAQLGQQRGDAYNAARASAIQQGTAAQSATFSQNMAARQQAIAEALRKRGQPLEEMRGMQGFLSMPGYQSVQGPNYLQAAMAQGDYSLQATAQDNQMYADFIKGATEFGSSMGSMFAMSDERAKRDVVRLEVEALPGVPFAEWTYLPEYGPPGRHLGVIAQDLERVSPQHVATRADGMKMVDYSFLEGIAHG